MLRTVENCRPEPPVAIVDKNVAITSWVAQRQPLPRQPLRGRSVGRLARKRRQPERHAQRNRLAPAHVAKLGGQVAIGLHYAHEQGIVHRDIKTANLVYTDNKVVKIMDFGLAKMVEEVRRSTTVVGGTPYYMAPEQSAGEQVDHRLAAIA